MKRTNLFFLKSLILFSSLFFIKQDFLAQNNWYFKNSNKKFERVKFKLINNLIVLPLKINGNVQNFILDTGVSKTILFNIVEKDSINLNNYEKVNLFGLGKGEPVVALASKNNQISLKKIVGEKQTVFVILKNSFDLSSKMGITINGIIGYTLLRNFRVKINYKSKYMDFYPANDDRFKVCKKCEVFPIEFFRRKPFIDIKVQLDTVGNKLTDTKVLIDSGGSDALWLFENTKSEIKTPKNFFRDLLGEGLSGLIYGNRSRLPKIKLNSFEIKSPTASFLDSLSTKNARVFKKRNGSIGANILKRFTVWLDYQNNMLILKKNGFYNDAFDYNMSGLEVVYNGKQLVKQETETMYIDSYNQNVNPNSSLQFLTNYTYKFKPSYKIKSVLPNSPGEAAGLETGDVILRINNKAAHEYRLSEIAQKFQEKDGKKIRLIIERNGKRLKFQFKLKKKV